MSDERTCATCWHCYEGSGSGTCRRCRASGEVVSEYRADPEAIAAHLRARVAELERDLAAEQERSEGWRDRAGAAAQSVAELESRASAAVEAHAALLSRIAADGTLDAMERASAAEQRVKELESELDTARKMQRWDADCASAAEQLAKRLEGALRESERWIVEHDGEPDDCECSYCAMLARIRAALAASESEVSHG